VVKQAAARRKPRRFHEGRVRGGRFTLAIGTLLEKENGTSSE
jgi:hypothetical protein